LEIKPAIGVLVSILLGLSLTLVILATNGLALVFDAGLYARGEVEQRIEETYGLSQSVLGPVNAGIVDYFGNDKTLAESFRAAGADSGFFKERETVHMEDVRGLIRLVGTIERTAIGFGVLSLLVLVVLFGRGAVERIGAGLTIGGAVTIALVAFLGVLTMIDFGGLFTQLHMLSFTNDFWILDPRTDHLIQMFPFGFWKSAMIDLVGRWLATSAATVALGLLIGWFGRRLA
jgi:integral membrane protein (TIGR01906 family)